MIGEVDKILSGPEEKEQGPVVEELCKCQQEVEPALTNKGKVGIQPLIFLVLLLLILLLILTNHK